MAWEPIEKYDAYKRPPKHCIFWFKATPARYANCIGLAGCRGLERTNGNRVCTHFHRVSEPPHD